MDRRAAGENSLTSYHLTTQALDDLWQIARFYSVEKRNPAAADRVIMAIHDACSRAGADPGIGKPQDAVEPGLCSKLVRRYPYTIFYRLSRPGAGFGIDVVRILHQSSDAEAALADLG